MAEVIDESGHQLVWTARYWRYGHLEEETCDSLPEAYGFLRSGEAAGEMSAEDVIGPEGRIAMTSEEVGQADAYGVKPDDLLVHLRQTREVVGG